MYQSGLAVGLMLNAPKMRGHMIKREEFYPSKKVTSHLLPSSRGFLLSGKAPQS